MLTSSGQAATMLAVTNIVRQEIISSVRQKSMAELLIC